MAEEITVIVDDLTEEVVLGNSTAVTEAPVDGNQYARKDAGWEVADGEANTIDSEPIGSEVQVLQVVSISQANYDLITPIATTFYIIT